MSIAIVAATLGDGHYDTDRIVGRDYCDIGVSTAPPPPHDDLYHPRCRHRHRHHHHWSHPIRIRRIRIIICQKGVVAVVVVIAVLLPEEA